MAASLVKTSPQDTCAPLRGRDLLSIRDLTRDDAVGLSRKVAKLVPLVCVKG